MTVGANVKGLERDWRLLAQRRTLRQLGTALYRDDLLGMAAEVSFYALFALFPFLLFLASVVGMLVPRPEEAISRLFVVVQRLLPSTAANLMTEFLKGPIRADRPYLLSLGILGLLWAGSQGFAAMLKALNRVFCANEMRNWARRRALSLAIMLAAALACLIVLLVMTAPDIGSIASTWMTLPPLLSVLWSWLRWPFLFVVLCAVLGWLYTTVPCAERHRRWITPGAIVASFTWMLASLAFAAYMDRSPSYARLYGAIGDIIILMLWIYVGTCTVLLGAEINAVLLRARRPQSKVMDMQTALLTRRGTG